MHHFVALLWNPADQGAHRRATQLSERLRRASPALERPFSVAGMEVYTAEPSSAGSGLYRLACDSGVVLGRLFPGESAGGGLDASGHFDAKTSSAIVTTAGQYLVRNFWGSYVALLRDPADQRAYALRDSSGMMPCYYTRSLGVAVVFADLADLEPLRLPAFTVNWEYLAAFIYSSQLQVRACAFKEVQEILAGECLQVGDNSTQTRLLWDPRSLCRDRWIDDYREAVEQLKRTAQTCMDAWAETSTPILHSLSGGFDSAVILGCLAGSRARPRITCLNQFAAASHDDERRYARLAAQRAGVQLIEIPMEAATGHLDSRLLAGPILPKPSVPGLFRVLETELINQIAADTGANALWTGQGGDHIFLQTSSDASAGDYLSIRGPRPGFISAVRDAAHLSRHSYWHVLKSACSRGRATPLPHNGLARESYFVAPDALPDDVDAYVTHPWATEFADLPKGKQMQVQLLAEVTHRHRPLPHRERAPQLHPLLSQPLVELCLRIPTYLLVQGGRERALARDAFADRIPAQIIHRRDKGSIVSHATDAIRNGEDFIREVLLEGRLMEVGVITRGTLEPYILQNQPFREEQLLPLLACLAAEVWTRAVFGYQRLAS